MGELEKATEKIKELKNCENCKKLDNDLSEK